MKNYGYIERGTKVLIGYIGNPYVKGWYLRLDDGDSVSHHKTKKAAIDDAKALGIIIRPR